LRKLFQAVAVTHPYLTGVSGNSCEQRIVAESVTNRECRAPVLAVIGQGNVPACRMREKTHAVTNTEKRNVEVENSGFRFWCAVVVDTGRTARQHDPVRLERMDAFERRIERMHLAIDARFANPSGDQLGVLAAEIQNDEH
jgi:hypothetical protein